MTRSPGATGATAPMGGQPSGGGAGLLQSAVRRDIVDTLSHLPDGEREQGLSAQELGQQAGLHVTTVRFHLDQLVEAGLVTSHAVRTPGAGRPSKKYLIASGPSEASLHPESHAMLTALLIESFAARTSDGAPLTPEQAGAAWASRNAKDLQERVVSSAPAATPGAWLSKIGLMIDVLRAWGYTPNLRTLGDGHTVEVDIVTCPFLALAHEHPDVLCGVHGGLMRGTLEVLGEQDAELSLTPFVEPTRCTAHITTRANFAPRGGTT